MEKAHSLRQVNRAIHKVFSTVNLYRGEGYHFISSDDRQMALTIAGLHTSGIYTYSIGQLTVQEWVNAVKALLQKATPVKQQYKTYNQKEAQEYLQRLYQQHKIRVYKTSATSSGHAKIKSRLIKVPVPTNIDRFGVCLHEVKHIIDGNKGKRFEQEFDCDMYALKILRDEFGFDTTAWELRMRWHSLSRIAMAVNRGLAINKIRADIRAFFSEVNFTTWQGKKVFVAHSKTAVNGYSIYLTTNYTKDEVEQLLEKLGYELGKSEIDDSTYGLWMVSTNKFDTKYEVYFNNLSEIINHYKL